AEVQSDAVLSARDLGGVGAALGDGGDDDGVAGLAGARRDDDAITDAEMRVRGEAAVYCDRAWRVLRVATRDRAWRVLQVATRDGAWRVLRRRCLKRDGEQDDAQRCRTP